MDSLTGLLLQLLALALIGLIAVLCLLCLLLGRLLLRAGLPPPPAAAAAAEPVTQLLTPPASAPPRIRYFYLRPGQPPQGPAELNTVRAMLADGRLARSAYVAAAGTDDWRPVAELLVECSEPR